ncbi:MAG: T9SS type A sorting domain-containing protein [Prolixibacteraceae bacterium]|jgi:lysyl endopeptidase|nr:T9SS type A sorting domain-containing protein [Prolixibacteraceae bacterium]
MRTYLLLFVLLSLSLSLKGQLSEGGMPLDVPVLKSAASGHVIELPSYKIEKKATSVKHDGSFKSITFAHSFEVNYTKENSGTYFEHNNLRIWRVHIKSEGAKSLNLIFSKFYVPNDARLFVFNPDKTVVLGAFTSKNNKPFKKLAIYPLPGDELILQYEEPINAEFEGELEVGKVNHDFIGIVSLKNSWERRLSGDCNIDVNCETESGLQMQQRGVCRILAGNELGTATLMNNTAEDGRPMLLSAYHIYDDEETAQITIFDFNYESPFCTEIDGYDNQSISGAMALASSEKLDFMLVELSAMPPVTFRPYYVGWDATNKLPSNTYTIHHPNGDTKKISHDEGQCDSMTFSRKFLENSHWKVFNWEEGTTEAGSSGACLFNTEKRAVGTLSGGYALCSNNSYDAFSRLDKMWDVYSGDSMQLEYWLDPIQTGAEIMNGFDPYEATEENCTAISNFTIYDSLRSTKTSVDLELISEVGERFNQLENASLSGVAIGIDSIKGGAPNSEIVIRLYSGEEKPVWALKQYRFSMSGITGNAMNYFNFGEAVDVEGSFYISVVLTNGDDYISVYQSAKRNVANSNTMFVNDNGLWMSMTEYNGDTSGASLLMQATVCGASFVQDSDTIDENDWVKVYPIPANNYFVVEFENESSLHHVSLFDMTGKLIFRKEYSHRDYAEIDASQFIPGIYIVNVNSNGINTRKRLIVNH